MKISEPLTMNLVEKGLRNLDQAELIPDWKPILVLPSRLIPVAHEFWGDSVTIIEQAKLPRSFR